MPLPDEHDSRTVLVRVRAAMPTLRQSEKRIAQLLLDDPATTASLSIAEFANRCDTSTTSVVRFYRRIGYRRYQDLRMDLLQESTRERLQYASLPAVSGDIDRDDTLEDVVSKVARAETLSIADTARTLDTKALARAVELLSSARRIDIFGVGASSFVGQDLQQKLSRIGLTALAWPDSHSAWTAASVLDSGCVSLAISHSGNTIDTVEFLRLAKEAGAATVALTNFAESPLAENADVILTTAARETIFRSGALGSRIAQLMVVDCLFTGIAQATYDQSMAALRTTYAAVHHRRM